MRHKLQECTHENVDKNHSAVKSNNTHQNQDKDNTTRKWTLTLGTNTLHLKKYLMPLATCLSGPLTNTGLPWQSMRNFNYKTTVSTDNQIQESIHICKLRNGKVLLFCHFFPVFAMSSRKEIQIRDIMQTQEEPVFTEASEKLRYVDTHPNCVRGEDRGCFSEAKG